MEKFNTKILHDVKLKNSIKSCADLENLADNIDIRRA
jgi:hypothetical protein